MNCLGWTLVPTSSLRKAAEEKTLPFPPRPSAAPADTLVTAYPKGPPALSLVTAVPKSPRADSTPEADNEVANEAQPISQVKREIVVRFATGMLGVDRVFGGGESGDGLAAQSVIALAALPGMGKSTLGLQILYALVGTGMSALYCTNEETKPQVADRAKRIGTMDDRLFIIREDQLEKILEQARKLDVGIVLIDSLQTIYTSSIDSRAGVTQVPLCAKLLADFGKHPDGGPIIFLICQVTAEGTLAGPNSVAHHVDVVVELAQLGTADDLRVFRCVRKNRFGVTTNKVKLRMTELGLVEVKDPPPNPDKDGPDDDADPGEGGPEIH